MFVRLLGLLLVTLVLWAVVARSSDGAAPGRVYVVRPHDTLWSIAAAHYGGDPRKGVWRLEKRNRLTGSLIRPGQRLVIP